MWIRFNPENDLRELKEKEVKILKKIIELKELEEDLWSFKMPQRYYTPNPRNYYSIGLKRN